MTLATFTPELVLFDYDGVLVDSLQSSIAVCYASARRLGLSIHLTRAHIEALEHVSFPEIGRAAGVPEASVEAFTRLIYDSLARDAADLHPFPGIPELVRALSRARSLGIISTNERAPVQAALGKHCLAGCFRLIYGGDLPGGKSDKIRLALREVGAGPEQAVMIGDSVNDIRHGKLAGVRTVAVTWGYQTRERLAREQPDFLINSPADLLELLAA